MAKKNLTVTATEAAAASTFSPEQVERIEERLSGLMDTIYLTANMASVIRNARHDDDIEVATILGHMSDLLMKVAGALDVAAIIPYAERTKEVTS